MNQNKINKLEKKEAGRPTKYSKEIVAKLESILKIGGTIEQACAYAGINKASYYRWLENNEDFATKMEKAKYYSDIMAKNIVVKAITEDKDLETAKWWLEKREFKTPQAVAAVQINQFGQILNKKSKDYGLDEI